MQIRAALLALVRYPDAIPLHLDFGRAIITARNQMELGFHSSSRSFWTRRRLGSFFPVPVTILVAGLTIFSRHFPP